MCKLNHNNGTYIFFNSWTLEILCLDFIIHFTKNRVVKTSPPSLRHPGEFGAVYEGILTQEEGASVRVAVKTIRGTQAKTHSGSPLEPWAPTLLHPQEFK